MNKYFKAGLAGLFLCLATLVSGCSKQVTAGGVTLEKTPVRIISLSPTHTEMLYAIGAGSQVVAVDEYSNYPQEAVELGTKLSGYEPNIEAIAGMDPDLVIVSYDPGSLVEQLGKLGIAVYIGESATSFDDTYAQLTDLGTLTGHPQEANELVTGLKHEISQVIEESNVIDSGLSYFLELDNTFFTVTSNTFIGQIFSQFGLTNIADNAEIGNDYPQLSSEVIVSGNPDLIFLADTKCCQQDAQTVASRDGWGGIKAVTNGKIVLLDDDLASRWGPRIVDLVRAIGKALSS